MSYNTYYIQNSGIPTSGNQLIPAPQISINPEYYYANDIPIGYTYNISLNGYATSLDTRTYVSGTLGFNEVLTSIQNIKNIFNGNDGTFLVLDQDNNLVFKAHGGIVRNLEFSESDNLWVNYSPYSIDLEFNEIEFADCSGSGVIPSCETLPSGIAHSPSLVDMKKYKIRSFDDSWSFELSDNIYSSYNFVKNQYIIATYTINATGKHYFVNNKLIPSWEQAKNFVQFRLKDQANRLIDSVLRRNNGDDCITDGYTLETAFNSGLYGLLDGLNLSETFSVYNEKISSQASESDGSFSATYTCLIKNSSINDQQLSSPESIHTFSTSKSVSDDERKLTTISVNGTIQGLIPYGLTSGSGIFKLSDNGQIISTNIPNSGKYTQALAAYNKIGTTSGLKDEFLAILDITNSSLGISENDCGIDPSGYPLNTSHTIAHNYTEGLITYSTTYDSDRACSRNKPIRNIRISMEEPIPMIREFIVPGRSGGPIIQRIGIDTPKKISVNIDGVQSPNLCCPNISGLVDNICSSSYTISGIPSPDITDLKLTSNKITTSKDGSYSISRTYICCSKE